MSATSGRQVTIQGAGPAGCAAALASIAAGGEALLVDRSPRKKHRVCGEFLSGEIEPLLAGLGLWDRFLGLSPQRYSRLVIHFPGVRREAALPSPAWGLSRLRFDSLLFDAARERGAAFRTAVAGDARPRVVAHGRIATAPRGRRLFGFKAHFDGEPGAAVELYFFGGGYVGVNAVEDGVNVCGVAPEHSLREMDFNADGWIARFAPLRARLNGARRRWDWLATGPLVFGNRLADPLAEGVYHAGDALSFVDPFTGSGLAAAVLTGTLAGRSAARSEPVRAHIERCRRAIAAPFGAAALFRWAWQSGWAGPALRFIPVPLGWLVQATRPRMAEIAGTK